MESNYISRKINNPAACGGVSGCHSGLALESISTFFWIPDQVRDDKTPQAEGY